jgi:hypothetical protein
MAVVELRKSKRFSQCYNSFALIIKTVYFIFKNTDCVENRLGLTQAWPAFISFIRN